MPKIEYIYTNFRQESLDLIETANRIIEDYQARGYELTLRQLYYQLVSRDIIPNTEKSYTKLGNTISAARDAGLVDWSAIVDRTRSRAGLTTWDDPGQIIRVAARSFRIDKWANQEHRVFVWVEKEALAGVIQRACTNEDIQVEYVSCRGYMSASTIWREAQLINRVHDNGQTPIVIHLGDHDPSGIDMTRDNMERLKLYSGLSWEFDLTRIALNMDQVEQYNPPPNPAKLTDTRIGKYIELYGDQSWELDALDPDVIVTLIQDTISSYKDEDKWQEMVEVEIQYKNKLENVHKNWDKI